MHRLNHFLEQLREKKGIYPNSKRERQQDKVKLLKYENALGYIVERAYELEETMVVANVDPSLEKDNEFFYSRYILDKEIAKARRLNLYLKQNL